MRKELGNIISLCLVWMLFLPSLVQLAHHHDHFVCHAKNEKHLHRHHEKCLICDFEFSAFSLADAQRQSTKVIFIDRDNVRVCKLYFSDYSKYSFLLRAPPMFNKYNQLV